MRLLRGDLPSAFGATITMGQTPPLINRRREGSAYETREVAHPPTHGCSVAVERRCILTNTTSLKIVAGFIHKEAPGPSLCTICPPTAKFTTGWIFIFRNECMTAS